MRAALFDDQPLLPVSVELDEPQHMVAQTQRVLPYQALRALGVSRLQSGHDFGVVDDGALGAILLEDGALANGGLDFRLAHL